MEPQPSENNNYITPPHDEYSEKALLGSILISPENYYEIEAKITKSDFYNSKHATIFEAIESLRSKSDPVDMITVSDELARNEKLDMVGGRAYIASLTKEVPLSANSKYYADIVYKKSQLRKLLKAGGNITGLALSGNKDKDVADIFDDAEKEIFNITQNTKDHKYTSMGDLISETKEELENLQSHDNAHRGVPTGFTDLDKKISGLQKTDLIILAARPSVGKTTFALDMVRNIGARSGLPVVFFSLEMSSSQLVMRLLATEARVDAWKLRTGKIDDASSYKQVYDALERLGKAPIYINDEAAITSAKMKSYARQIKAKHGLSLIVVDYLQLMTPSKNYDSMVNQVTEISRSLKIMAKELNVPVLALSQLSRAVEARGGKPRLSDLRDSGSIEQDADIVMFIHRENRGDAETGVPNITQILIEKHRNGPTGVVDLVFDERTTTFHSVDRERDLPEYSSRKASLNDL
ncbi:replicative DNA helicase [Candidatus Nomurabacteria bacterium]|nr:replicative DNA helicase [Candidatus Nomurabacteria bacterium]